jgi:hypothetical protein
VDLEHLNSCFYFVDEEAVFHDLELDLHCCGGVEASHFLHLMLGDDLIPHILPLEVVF